MNLDSVILNLDYIYVHKILNIHLCCLVSVDSELQQVH